MFKRTGRNGKEIKYGRKLLSGKNDTFQLFGEGLLPLVIADLLSFAAVASLRADPHALTFIMRGQRPASCTCFLGRELFAVCMRSNKCMRSVFCYCGLIPPEPQSVNCDLLKTDYY